MPAHLNDKPDLFGTQLYFGDQRRRREKEASAGESKPVGRNWTTVAIADAKAEYRTPTTQKRNFWASAHRSEKLSILERVSVKHSKLTELIEDIEKITLQLKDADIEPDFLAWADRGLELNRHHLDFWHDVDFGLGVDFLGQPIEIGAKTHEIDSEDEHIRQTEEAVVIEILQEIKNESAPIEKFRPTPELLSAWIAGLNAATSEVNQAPISEQEALDDSRYFEELASVINKVINNFGKLKAYDGGRYRLTFAGKFLPSVETLFVEHLMLPPRFDVRFLDELLSQIYLQSQRTSVFKGRWGELIVDNDNELVLDLNKRRSRSIAQVLKG